MAEISRKKIKRERDKDLDKALDQLEQLKVISEDPDINDGLSRNDQMSPSSVVDDTNQPVSGEHHGLSMNNQMSPNSAVDDTNQPVSGDHPSIEESFLQIDSSICIQADTDALTSHNLLNVIAEPLPFDNVSSKDTLLKNSALNSIDHSAQKIETVSDPTSSSNIQTNNEFSYANTGDNTDEVVPSHVEEVPSVYSTIAASIPPYVLHGDSVLNSSESTFQKKDSIDIQNTFISPHTNRESAAATESPILGEADDVRHNDAINSSDCYRQTEKTIDDLKITSENVEIPQTNDELSAGNNLVNAVDTNTDSAISLMVQNDTTMEIQGVSAHNYLQLPLIGVTQAQNDQPMPIEHEAPIHLQDVLISELQLPLPFFDVQMSNFYSNKILDEICRIEDTFLNTCQLPSHELKDLLHSYLRSITTLRHSEENVKALEKKSNNARDQLWTVSTRREEKTGRCLDHSTVVGHYEYTCAEFSSEARRALSDDLKAIRLELTEDLPLQGYTVQLNNLLIENYLYHLYLASPHFLNLPANAPVKLLPDYVERSIVDQIESFKSCLSVLFSYLRKSVSDRVFIEDIHRWILRLGGTLLRQCRSEDHLFLLQHLLRCPAGVGQWAQTLVLPVLESLEGPLQPERSFQMPLFDHTLAILAVLFRPIKNRVQFLADTEELILAEASNASSTDASANLSPWIVIDLEGEEDETIAESWHRLQENDIIAFLGQIPVVDLLRHAFGVSRATGSQSVESTVQEIYEPAPMQLYHVLAFVNKLLEVLSCGAETYSISRYRRLNQRICRTILRCLQVVTDHVSIVLEYLEETGYFKQAPLNTCQLLVAQYEDTYLRMIHSLLAFSHCGSWQFLVSCPYRLLTPPCKHRLLKLFTTDWLEKLSPLERSQVLTSMTVEDMEFVDVFGETSTRERDRLNLKNVEHEERIVTEVVDSLEELMKRSSQSDSIHLLTALSSLARECRKEVESEKSLVNIITRVIFRLSFVSRHTQDFCAKTGRELLLSIALTNSHILSLLITEVSAYLSIIQGMAIYLFRELPLYLYVPDEAQFSLLSDWLLNTSLDSVANQLARFILSKLNWDFSEETPSLLFMKLDFHRKMALLLVKAFRKHATSKQLLTNVVGDGMKLLLSLWSKSSAFTDQSFTSWCLSLISRLRLHAKTRLDSASLTCYEDNWVDMQVDAVGREIAAEMATQTNPVANFAGIVMSSMGHRILPFLEQGGIDFLTTLVSRHHQYYLATLALQYVTAFLADTSYIGRSDYLVSLYESEKFLAFFKLLAQGDTSFAQVIKSFVTEDTQIVCKLLASMMICNCINIQSPPRFLVDAPRDPSLYLITCEEKMLVFWLKVCTSQSAWYSDSNLCFLLDRLLFAAARMGPLGDDAQGHVVAAEEMFQVCKTFVSNQITAARSRHGLAAVRNVGMYLVTISQWLENAGACWSLPWLTYYVLAAEARFETSEQIWPGIQKSLAKQVASNRSKINVSSAISEVNKSLNYPVGLAVDRLSIYTLARFIPKMTNVDSLPLLGHLFFKFFFAFPEDVPFTSGPEPNLSSSGLHMFTFLPYSTLIKEVRQIFSSKSDGLLEEITTGTTEPSPDDSTESPPGLSPVRSVYLHKVANMFETFVMWVDEPRLHSPQLNMNSLPPQYNPDKLQELRDVPNPLNLVWWDLLDLDDLTSQLKKLMKPWKKQLTNTDRSLQNLTEKIGSHRSVPAQQRLLKKLLPDTEPIGLSPLPSIQPPVEDIEKDTLLDKRQLLVALNEPLNVLKQQAQKFSEKTANMTALDYHYLDFLPQLYIKEPVQAVLPVPCSKTSRGTYSCRGMAYINVQYETSRYNEQMNRFIVDNRTDRNQLLIELTLPPAKVTIKSVVQLEHVITDLVCIARSSSDPESTKKCAAETGIALFYHIAGIVSDVTQFYLPTKQLIAQCLEVLGQVFIQTNPSQAQPLLEAVLASPNLVGLLAPNFNPGANPDLFVDTYARMLSVASNQGVETAFSLLSKFDVQDWLKNFPGDHLRKSLIDIICNGLKNCGVKPSAEIQIISELYRVHLSSLTRFQFPAHLVNVLTSFLSAAEANSIDASCWDILKGAIEADVNANGELSLSIDKLQELLTDLGQHFAEARSRSLETGLYANWGPHAHGVVTTVALLLHGLIFKVTRSLQRGYINLENALNTVWHLILTIFNPWLAAIDLHSLSEVNLVHLGQPWRPEDTKAGENWPHQVWTVLIDVLTQFEEAISGSNIEISPALNLIISWYFTQLARPGVETRILSVTHQFLETMPWNKWCPSLIFLYSLIEFYSNQPIPSSRNFLGTVLAQVDWSSRWNQVATETSYLDSLFNIVIGLMADTSVLKLPSSERLLESLACQTWTLLDADRFKAIVEWFQNQGNCQMVVAEISSPEGRLMKFLASLADMKATWSLSTQPNDLVLQLQKKQIAYVQLVVTFMSHVICPPSSSLARQGQVSNQRYQTRLTNLLNELEIALQAVPSGDHRLSHGSVLCKELFRLLSDMPPHIVKLHEPVLIDWLTTSGSSPLLLPMLNALAKSPPNVRIATALAEIAILAYITMDSTGTSTSAQQRWSNLASVFCVDALIEDEMWRECQRSLSLLCLSVITIRQLQRCTTPENEALITVRLLEALTQIKLSPDIEEKILLLWDRLLDLIIREAVSHPIQSLAVRHITNFVPLLLALAETKINSGFFGKFGIGKKSPLSLRFRLVSRCLSTFLLAQLTSSKTLRLSPDAPGHASVKGVPSAPLIRSLDRSSSSIASSNSDITATPQAVAAMTQLNILISPNTNSSEAKEYAPVSGSIVWTLRFMEDKSNCLLEARVLLAQLIEQLYSNNHGILGVLREQALIK